MASNKLFIIEYDTPEQAAALVARINTNRFGGPVRAFRKGQTVEVASCNSALGSLFTFFSRVGESVVALFTKSGNSADIHKGICK